MIGDAAASAAKKEALKTARGIKTAFPDGVSVSAVRNAMDEMSGVAQRQVSDRIRTLGSATKNTLESNELIASAVRYVQRYGADGKRTLDRLDSEGVRDVLGSACGVRGGGAAVSTDAIGSATSGGCINQRWFQAADEKFDIDTDALRTKLGSLSETQQSQIVRGALHTRRGGQLLEDFDAPELGDLARRGAVADAADAYGLGVPKSRINELLNDPDVDFEFHTHMMQKLRHVEDNMGTKGADDIAEIVAEERLYRDASNVGGDVKISSQVDW